MFLVLLFAGHFVFAMENFDQCLKDVPACAKLQEKSEKKAEKKLKAFVQNVVSKAEQMKYKCVPQNMSLRGANDPCKRALQHFEFHKSCNSVKTFSNRTNRFSRRASLWFGKL